MKRILPLFWIGLTLLLSWMQGSLWLYANQSFETERPYIYRQFVPVSARQISSLTDLSINQAIVFVIVLCALGFAFAARYLYKSFHEQTTNPWRVDLFVILSVNLLFLTLVLQPKQMYDVPTAFFFTLALALL